jgi:predicted lipid-binding transport protein (Tim44 family)
MTLRARMGALVLCALLALAPAVAEARAGGGFSAGSRGARTYSAPPSTRTAPAARPVERSVTPTAPAQSATPAGAVAGSAVQPGFGQRNPFLTGLMGGFIGAGIGGLLFGHGFGMGGLGFAGGLGLILQLALLGALGWLVVSYFRNRRSAAPMAYSAAGLGSRLRDREPMFAGPASPASSEPGPEPQASDEVGIGSTDFSEFEHLLEAVQHAWSGGDVAALRRLATPEMLAYFSEQLAMNTSRGIANTVEAVKLEQGDLAEAWREGAVDYATVAMRFSALDYASSLDDGRVVDGSKTERVDATEVWTFMRQTGGRWILSAIQQ